MKFPTKYPFLKKNIFSDGEYSIVPIRYEDRMKIMQWRNEQIYHLRQAKPLTETDQENYFNNVVAQLFEQEQPNQILFSYLKNGECIGYGGLVHINWIDKNAEISFVMNTKLENDEFHFHWRTYLKLLEKVAFEGLSLHKIYTYAFDIRPHLYKAVESAGFTKEAVLKEHFYFNGKFKDVVIHSKVNGQITIRKVEVKDAELLFDWANDELTRQQSFQLEEISWKEHLQWFHNKMNDSKAQYYICEVQHTPVGLVRFDTKENQAVIGITIDANFRGQKLASIFLKKCCKIFLEKNKHVIYAYVKQENIASIKSFTKAGFILKEETTIKEIPTYIYVYE